MPAWPARAAGRSRSSTAICATRNRSRWRASSRTRCASRCAPRRPPPDRRPARSRRPNPRHRPPEAGIRGWNRPGRRSTAAISRASGVSSRSRRSSCSRCRGCGRERAAADPRAARFVRIWAAVFAARDDRRSAGDRAAWARRCCPSCCSATSASSCCVLGVAEPERSLRRDVRARGRLDAGGARRGVVAVSRSAARSRARCPSRSCG